ncbi:MAG: DUF2946 family protein [Gammaproteobacteria bacterium]|nr:DUF2946 family protein [Gammaproteobacteria bacterium]MBU1440625.1 DUF2946 family protein [Gammaproteobacteria bacterium]MBU2408867.1 DUF2946 family protein [Gammaproteobacteria bacterium]
MDDIVKQALAKWPNVPHCYGWLGLDARGNWYMRDDRTQAQGPFTSAKGSLLRHDKLIDFIQRNYDHDAQGQWFFQNGPQRVYVELEVAPWIWRLGDDFSVRSHSGIEVEPSACLLDEAGRLYLVAPIGLGLVHTQDVGIAAEAIEQGRWVPQDVRSQDLPERYGFMASPQSARETTTAPPGR